MYISVIISTHNRADLLPKAVASLARARARCSAPCEIILVDNCSTDDTANVIRWLCQTYPQVLALHEPKPGLSNGRNCGMSQAKGDVLAFTDDDVQVDEMWLDEIAVTFQHDVAFASGRIRPLWQESPPPWLEIEAFPGPLVNCDFGDEPFLVTREKMRGLPMGANMSFRRDALERVGGFNGGLGMRALPGGSQREIGLVGEDQEVCLRLLEAGYSGFYNPQLVVFHTVHRERLTRRYLLRWRYAYGKSQSMIGLGREDLPRVLGVPRYLVREFLEDLVFWAWWSVWRDAKRRFTRGAGLATFAGFVSHRWFGRGA